jgi:hypothetical protein
VKGAGLDLLEQVADLSARHQPAPKAPLKLAWVPNPSGSEGFGF